MLFTGAAFSAEECRQLGMVNHVVPREDLERFTLEMAKRIATRPTMGLRLAKLAVNQSLDAQGRSSPRSGSTTSGTRTRGSSTGSRSSRRDLT
ncbi:MAG: enoyl-CoA hydratase-related protein [Candidatus Binatia bacterium]